jgi:asparagine synthase (glutamine-hydrolysing)
MCGIIASYTAEQTSSLENKLHSALQLLTHRGPDEEGLCYSEGMYMGHRRLSILDLAASKQPMSSPDGRYHLCFNGEIYNFQELRQELSDLWSFVTLGDTEVLMAGLVCQGTQFLSKLNGMWAFIFWDSIEKKVLLSRDRFGKKPLYYSQLEGFKAASELPALLTMLHAIPNEDVDTLADYLRYGHSTPGYTFYQQIFEVLPAHYLLIDLNNKIVEQRAYWTLPTQPNILNYNEALIHVRDRFSKAVKLRMVSDVEVGVFLSGGIDSSLVLSEMAAQSEINGLPKAFTLGFSDLRYDETASAQLMAQRIGVDHKVKILKNISSDEIKLLLNSSLGQPFGDASILPTLRVCELASEYVKVVLSGDGADEVFCGYQRYQARLLFRLYQRSPRILQRLFVNLLGFTKAGTGHHSRSVIKKAQLFLTSYERFLENPNFEAPTLAPEKLLNLLLPGIDSLGHDHLNFDCLDTDEEVLKMMRRDMTLYLPQDILPKVDRASMFHSLEVRSPFLDPDLVSLALSLPRKFHRRGFVGKKLLRDAFHNRLPDALWRKRKQGFAVPVADWFKNHLGDELDDLLFNKQISTPLVAQGIRSLLKAHRQGKADHSSLLWSIYVYYLWHL